MTLRFKCGQISDFETVAGGDICVESFLQKICQVKIISKTEGDKMGN